MAWPSFSPPTDRSSRSASRAPTDRSASRVGGEAAGASNAQQAIPTGFYFRPLSQRPTLAVAVASASGGAGAGLASSRAALEAQVFSEMLTSRHASASDKLKAATELGNLALQDAESSEIISSAGAVETLVALTRAGTTREQRERAAGALRNLAAHSDKNKRVIVDAGGVRRKRAERARRRRRAHARAPRARSTRAH